MFARLLAGLDGGVRADVALEQAIVVARRFGSAITVACVREPGGSADPALGERARFRVTAAGLEAAVVERDGDPGRELVELGRAADAVIIGRARTAPGATVTAVLRGTRRPVVVCASTPSPLRHCAVAVDGGEASRRAVRLAARVAAATGDPLELLHAAEHEDAVEGVMAPAEELLVGEGAAFHGHVRAGRPAEVITALVREVRADVLFVAVSHAEDFLDRLLVHLVVQP